MTECSHCGYTWTYTGQYSEKATCPDCQRKTPLGESDE